MSSSPRPLPLQRRLWEGWKRVATRIAVVQTAIILGLLYFTLLGLTACLARLTGWDPLARRHRAASYWLPREEPAPDLQRATKPF